MVLSLCQRQNITDVVEAGEERAPERDFRSPVGEGPPFCLEVADHVLDDLVEIRIDFHGVIAVNPRDQVRTLAKVGCILLAPFDPLMISIAQLHS